MSTAPRSGTAARSLLAVLAATPVHALTLAALAGAVALWWPGTDLWQKFLGVLLLLLVGALLLPGRRAKDGHSEVDLRHARATAALLEQVGTAIGGTAPRRLLITRAYAAGLQRGRGGRALVVGAPLWAALDGEGRIALLGRTLAPTPLLASVRDGYVAVALRALLQWHQLLGASRTFHPNATVDPAMSAWLDRLRAGRARYRLQNDVVTVVLWPLRMLASGNLMLLHAICRPLRAGLAEDADAAASTVAGADALAALNRALEDHVVVETLAQRASRTGADVQETIAERTRRLSESRIATVAHGSVHVSPTQWDQIDAEWAGALSEQFAHLRSDYR